ncbi:macrophage mannose receptor 1-like [Ctenopharyngodon idella]|uniref:macrophage mannose receptor 1-like n=1 Tax=Ctenopharyngodon idella TaxID=7959 RepID=UPI00222FAC44|nr:macrophage mannose receptor 1-like [Ctenopharyngodon idella]XP_051757320.1 macrophage mannose receptor 1-like [Ctenopharyngodon idella]
MQLVYGEELTNLISAAMEQRLIHLFLLSGFLYLILCGSCEYILIQEKKTWKEAQDHCRQNYIDLATVQTDEEWSELSKLRAELQFYIWIGLYDDVNSWHWSFQNETFNFFLWDTDQPNNLHGKQYCVNLRSTGYWWDEDCNLTYPFFCQNGEGQPVLVTDPAMSWNDAQNYCREHYTDLFTVRNRDENKQLTTMIKYYTCGWIGLFRDSWKWLNQTSMSPYFPLRWAAGQPDNSFANETCAALDDYGHIADETCKSLHFFLCQIARVKQQVLRLEVKAGDNVNDQAITAALLNKVQQTLREQGMAADVKLAWREQPDGMVFQKMKNGSTGMNEEL